MKYLNIPESVGPRMLPFYLAAEEWVARSVGTDDVFFMWQVDPTVIVGRNQVLRNELDLEYCRTHNIRFYRRKSGGGCVYADRNNVMFSYITRSDHVATTFARYTQAVADMLRRLGLNATVSGRNDVEIDGLKVSGNAFYHLPGRSIVHGTMLYDVDEPRLERVLTPSTAKLLAKGVQSVRSRVTAIVRHLPTLTLNEFKDFAKTTLCHSEVTLSDSDVLAIEAISRHYERPEFIYGLHPQSNVVRSGRIEGVGEMTVSLVVDNQDIIRYADLSGDFFVLSDIDSGLLKPLLGCPLQADALTEALIDIHTSDIVAGLSKRDFINLLTNNR